MVMTDETAEKAAQRAYPEISPTYPGEDLRSFGRAGFIQGAEWGRASRDVEVAELRAQVERLAGLNDVFLNMRDRVSGYVSAPPLAHFFQQGGNAFEWAATSVRRAAAGEPPLVPPVPIRELGDDDSTEDGYRHRVLTCEVCGKRFVCVTEVRIDHQVFDNDPTYVYHHGRPLDKTGDNR